MDGTDGHRPHLLSGSHLKHHHGPLSSHVGIPHPALHVDRLSFIPALSSYTILLTRVHIVLCKPELALTLPSFFFVFFLVCPLICQPSFYNFMIRGYSSVILRGVVSSGSKN